MLTYTRYMRKCYHIRHKIRQISCQCRDASSRRKTAPAISDNISFSRERCIDKIRDEGGEQKVGEQNPDKNSPSSCFKNILFTIFLSFPLPFLLSLPYLNLVHRRQDRKLTREGRRHSRSYNCRRNLADEPEQGRT